MNKSLSTNRYRKQVAITVLFFFIIIAGWIYAPLGYIVPLCMVFGIGLGIAKGRIWCNYYCPRGSFFDTVGKSISPEAKIPAFFKSNPFRILVIAVMMGMMSIQILIRWPDFLSIGSFFVRLVTGVTFAGIILALLFHQRTWCSFCPVGSLSNWLGRKKYFLKIDSALCNECRLCARVCPIQIEPYKYKSEGINPVADKDCLRCGLCKDACPRNALTDN
jgi:polyferredoxin